MEPVIKGMLFLQRHSGSIQKKSKLQVKFNLRFVQTLSMTPKELYDSDKKADRYINSLKKLKGLS